MGGGEPLEDSHIRQGLTFVRTCWACPEQYDVFKDGKQVGYLRLRHGYFATYYPDHTGEILWDTNAHGDGIFYDQEERDLNLDHAATMLNSKLKGEPDWMR